MLSTITADGTQNLNGANTDKYFGYNIAGGSANGTAVSNAGYPSGWQFNKGLVETSGSVSATFLGSTTGTETKVLGTDTWVKGATESAGNWNVVAGQASILGGYTNANMQGTMTITLGATYTSFGSLIGTNPGAVLNVTVEGFDTTSATPNVAVFSFADTGITHSTSNPDFIGYAGTSRFNKIVITAAKGGSTTASNNNYPAYGNAAFIALDQAQFGSYQPVPAPPAAISLMIGSAVGMVGTGFNRFRAGRKRKKA